MITEPGDKMRFSIVIPVYNVEKYLQNCLNSVVEQEYQDYEILLINDGSTDSSGDICMRYAEQYNNIRYACQKNAGPSKARNRGIEMARGEYLLFLDSDDELERNCLKELEEIILESDADAVISSEKVREREDSQPIEIPLGLEALQINTSKESALRELSQKRFALMTHKVIIKRQVIVDNSLFFNVNYGIGEDILMIAQSLCQCNSFRLNEKPYYIYNYNDSSIMRTISFDKIWQTTDICRDLYELAQVKTSCEQQLLYTTISMLMVSFTQYYAGFTSKQRAAVKKWMKNNRSLLNIAADTHSVTKWARRFIGAPNAFLMAGGSSFFKKA